MSAATPGSSTGCRTGQARTSWRQPHMQGIHHVHLGASSWGFGPSTSRLSEASADRGSVIVHARRKWYAIFEPASARGVYRFWEQVKREVIGYSGAVHKGFASEAAALKWILELDRRAKEEEDRVFPLREQVAKLASAAAEASVPGRPALEAGRARQSVALELAAISDSTATAAATAGPGDADAALKQRDLEPLGPRPWETSPIVLDMDAVPTREYYRKWYAVRFVDGGRPGVYNTWQEAEAAMNGRYAEHRSFGSYPEALTYAFGSSYAQQLLQEPAQHQNQNHSHLNAQEQHHHRQQQECEQQQHELHHQHQHQSSPLQRAAWEPQGALSAEGSLGQQHHHRHQRLCGIPRFLADVVRHIRDENGRESQQHGQPQSSSGQAVNSDGGWDQDTAATVSMTTAHLVGIDAEDDYDTLMLPLPPLQLPLTTPQPAQAATRALALAAADGADVVRRTPVNPGGGQRGPWGAAEALPGLQGWPGWGPSGGGGGVGRPLPAPPLLSMAPVPWGGVLPPGAAGAAVPTSGLVEAARSDGRADVDVGEDDRMVPSWLWSGDRSEQHQQQGGWDQDGLLPSHPASTLRLPLNEVSDGPPGPRLGRGRPPRLQRPEPQPQQHPNDAAPSTSGRSASAAPPLLPASRGPGRPRKSAPGGGPGATKRPPGRPRSVVVDAGGEVAATPLGGLVATRPKGRPHKPGAGSTSSAAGAAWKPTASSTPEPQGPRLRGRSGRQAASAEDSGGSGAAAATAREAAPAVKRARGRPPKAAALPADGDAAALVAGSCAAPGGRGVPAANPAVPAPIVTVLASSISRTTAGASTAPRRRGRPPKAIASTAAAAAAALGVHAGIGAAGRIG